MAEYKKKSVLGRIAALLLLIFILAAGGIFWFDFLNIIDAKDVLSPIYRLIGLESRTQPEVPEDAILNLNDERYAILVEALDLQKMEIQRQEIDIQIRQGEILQIAQELDEQKKALDDQEKALIAQLSDADIRDRNVEQHARNLTGMPPERAVGILEAMDDQLVIDVLRKTEEIAQAEGASSIVSYWLSLMPPNRVAEISRKMTVRPPNL